MFTISLSKLNKPFLCTKRSTRHDVIGLSITCYQEIVGISGSESHTRKKKRGVSINSVPTQLQFSLRVDGFQENRRRAAFHLPISSVTASFT